MIPPFSTSLSIALRMRWNLLDKLLFQLQAVAWPLAGSSTKP